MSTVLILHGIGGQAGIHWQQWLHDELVRRGVRVIMPTLSHGEHPDRAQWLAETARAVQGVAPSELIIVGHSLGVTTALDYIAQASEPIKALVSVSGFAYDYGAELNGYFLREQTIDFTKVRPHLGTAVVLYGDDDPYVRQTALQDLAKSLGVAPIIIPGGGHLNTEKGYTTFPRLLAEIEKLR